MNDKDLRVGFAFCGSFCTMSKALAALEQTAARFGPVTPIVSETVESTDTRFGAAHDFMREMERICSRRVVSTVAGAEPIGPKGLLDVLAICPCTGNTLAKLAHGVTDTAVTMAAKAHLRNGRPLVLALATNDGLSGSAPNLGMMLNRRHVFFVPFGQDDCAGKPASLVADFSLVPGAIRAAAKGEQLQPLLLGAG
ncbi:MAG: dipicolinate synthase subunit B [Oscillospiraceae bacterium]|nr:dipicolinate synthase subunit B [Oscillospiraceae bacterium]MCI9308923.1 dipicolinate synthase subunit B [Oscillospiraceae bacterium]MCI9549818.1 dipicolinate synthase subunit B [Oscillospiraceae bacterium]